MSKTKKTIAAVAAVALLCAACIAGTAAYFNAKTGPVTNTFAAGALFDEGGEIVLDESKATQNTDGTYSLGTDRVTSNTYEGILPGDTLPKDPTITVSELAQNAYLFITVEDETEGLTWTLDTAWTQVATGVYAYNTVLAPAAGDQTFNIIADKQVVVDDELEEGAELGDLVFNAYICQATGFDSAAAAWIAVFAD